MIATGAMIAPAHRTRPPSTAAAMIMNFRIRYGSRRAATPFKRRPMERFAALFSYFTVATTATAEQPFSSPLLAQILNV